MGSVRVGFRPLTLILNPNLNKHHPQNTKTLRITRYKLGLGFTYVPADTVLGTAFNVLHALNKMLVVLSCIPPPKKG
jgi:hypothetical protein